MHFVTRILSQERTLSLNVLCQPMHCAISHTCSWRVILARVHQWMTSNSQYTLPPQSFVQKKSASGTSQLRPKQSSNGPYPENFMTIGSCFEYYTYRIIVLVWLKKEEQRKKERKKEMKEMNNSDFWLFHVCHFKVHIANTTADWGKLYKRLCVLLYMRICKC